MKAGASGAGRSLGRFVTQDARLTTRSSTATVNDHAKGTRIDDGVPSAAEVPAMIRNEAEYREALTRLKGEMERLEAQRIALRRTGLTTTDVKRVCDPMESFYLQLKEEIESYERFRRGEFSEIHNFRGIGQLLIGLRVARGLSQRELAERLGVHESQVSRDERNEYSNITVERAVRILGALDAEVVSVVKSPSLEMT